MIFRYISLSILMLMMNSSAMQQQNIQWPRYIQWPCFHETPHLIQYVEIIPHNNCNHSTACSTCCIGATFNGVGQCLRCFHHVHMAQRMPAELLRDQTDFEQHLIFSCNTGDIETAHILLQRGVDPNTRELGLTKGDTPLMFAAKGGWATIVDLLLQHKADPNKLSLDGRTALHSCISLAQNHPTHKEIAFSILRCLLKAGANPDLHKPLTLTPLLQALRFHALIGKEFAELLLQAGANPNHSYINKPLAEVRGNPQMTRLLQGYGAKQ